jgi:hypothetical protein
MQKKIIALVSRKTPIFSRGKWGKLADKHVHNIDRWFVLFPRFTFVLFNAE